jgi:hypothetical protein
MSDAAHHPQLSHRACILYTLFATVMTANPNPAIVPDIVSISEPQTTRRVK